MDAPRNERHNYFTMMQQLSIFEIHIYRNYISKSIGFFSRMKRPKSSKGTLDDLLKPHMGGMSLLEAVEKELLYMVDYTEMLQNVSCKTGLVWSIIILPLYKRLMFFK